MSNKVSFIIQFKDRFSKVNEKLNAGLKKAQRNAKKLGEDAKITAQKIKASLQNIKTSFGNVGRSMAKTGAVMTAAVTVPMAMMAKSMVDAGSDAVETANKFNTVFDDVKGKANQTASEFAKSFGTATSTAQKLIGNTGDLLVGFGFSGDSALDFSRRVNEAAADLTSFQNVEGGVEAASKALTKAILGEAESAKSLGIVIRQDTKEFRQKVKVLSRVKRITEQQARAEVIFQQILSQSQKSVGDVSRTWDDYANVQRRAVEKNKEMRESFGRLLLPIATKLQNAIIFVTEKINKLSPEMKDLVLIIGGVAAAAGPLLFIMGGIGIAVAAISAPVLAVTAALMGIGAAVAYVSMNFEKFENEIKLITDIATGFWNVLKEIGVFIGETFAKAAILIDNFSFDSIAEMFGNLFSGSVDVNAPELLNQTTAPTVSGVPVNSANATLNGQIKVSADAGTTVKSTAMNTKASGFDVGVNMGAAYG